MCESFRVKGKASSLISFDSPTALPEVDANVERVVVAISSCIDEHDAETIVHAFTQHVQRTVVIVVQRSVFPTEYDTLQRVIDRVHPPMHPRYLEGLE